MALAKPSSVSEWITWLDNEMEFSRDLEITDMEYIINIFSLRSMCDDTAATMAGILIKVLRALVNKSTHELCTGDGPDLYDYLSVMSTPMLLEITCWGTSMRNAWLSKATPNPISPYGRNAKCLQKDSDVDYDIKNDTDLEYFIKAVIEVYDREFANMSKSEVLTTPGPVDETVLRCIIRLPSRVATLTHYIKRNSDNFTRAEVKEMISSLTRIVKRTGMSKYIRISPIE